MVTMLMTSEWRLDAGLATAMLFAVVLVPPLVGVRMMYTLCWLLFTALALLTGSSAALGLATSMGITIMVGWYALRVFDRGAFTAGLQGWLGVWASSRAVGLVARIGDVIVHLLLPMVLISCYLPLVRIWMSIPALISSRLWIRCVVGGGVFPKGDTVFRFTPPRSQHFWNAAYRIELLLNLCVPTFCVLAIQRSFWVYAVTALGGVMLFGLHIIRSLSLKKLRANAKSIMSRLLRAGGLVIETDFVVRSDAIWLDWMRDGLVAIGETYVGGLWDSAPTRTVDELVTALMTIPMEARQEMYRSWSARLVALAARLFNYPPSSKGLVVGAAADQFELSPAFRRAYMDRYIHQSFGLWVRDARDLDNAQANKLADLSAKLVLEEDAHHHVLDLCLGSRGGVGIYLAEHHPTITVVSLVTSVADRAYALRFAEELGVQERVEFVLVESPDKLLTALSSFNASRFTRITGSGVAEIIDPFQLARFFRTIKRILAPGGRVVVDFIACGTIRSTTHVWTNKYIDDSAFPTQPLTLHRVRHLLELSGFTVDEIAGYTEHYERTFMEWHRRFQGRWGEPLAGGGGSRPTAPARAATPNPRQTASPSLPESFRRTWEFYLLHSAACYRAQILHAYQLQVS